MKSSMPSLGAFTELALRNLAGLKDELTSKGISLHEAARLTGIGITAVELYATNKVIPSAKDYNRLARLFGWEKLGTKKTR